jgi:hypothetical protein
MPRETVPPIRCDIDRGGIAGYNPIILIAGKRELLPENPSHSLFCNPGKFLFSFLRITLYYMHQYGVSDRINRSN